MKKQINKESEEFAKQWIKQGKPCTYRFGWVWDGGKSHKLSKKEAMKMLPKYSFGISIYCLSFINIDGAETLEFNELPENALLVWLYSENYRTFAVLKFAVLKKVETNNEEKSFD